MGRLLTDEELVRIVFWPEGLSATEIREMFRRVRRYIDLDWTIAFRGGSVVAQVICGRPLVEFLEEEPFIVHSHGSNAVPFFTEHFPDLPKPEAIIFPPLCRFIGPLVWEDDYVGHSGKDFEALGVTGAVIIDDMMPYRIHAPGCTVVQPYEGSPYDQLRKILGV